MYKYIIIALPTMRARAFARYNLIHRELPKLYQLFVNYCMHSNDDAVCADPSDRGCNIRKADIERSKKLENTNEWPVTINDNVKRSVFDTGININPRVIISTAITARKRIDTPEASAG